MSAKEEKKEQEKVSEEIEYEKFCDCWAYNFKDGIFILELGQSCFEIPKMFVKIFVDPKAMKGLASGLQDVIKDYEKEHGKIK